MPQARLLQPIVLGSVEFSALATGPTALFTTDSTSFLPLFLVIYLRGVTGFVTVPTISIGTNGPTYNNLVPATAMTGLDAVGEYFRIPFGTSLANGVFRGLGATSSVTLGANVTVAASATTYNVEIYVMGAYI